MLPIKTLITRSTLLLILSGFDFCFLLIAYSVLRALRISVNWTTWIAGGLIISASLALCVHVAFPDMFPDPIRAGGNILGALAFFVAVYSACQWITRQWFLRVKKSADERLRLFVKNVLMFVREHHIFFGLVVGAGALAHLVFFLPVLEHIGLYEEVTGFIAIGILALIALLGLWLWIEGTLRKRRMPRLVHTIHSALTIAFFVVLFLHI